MPERASVGELAAIACMVERDSLRKAHAAGAGRVLLLDFDAVLADLEASLAKVLGHFDLPRVAGRLAKSPAPGPSFQGARTNCLLADAAGRAHGPGPRAICPAIISALQPGS